MKFSRIIFAFLINISSIYAVKDCPSDMILWTQPGTDYSDCVCPTGQSLSTNLYNTNTLYGFGRCTENYIPISRSWAFDISLSLKLWLDGDDPYGNGYRLPNGTDMTTWIDKSSVIGTTLLTKLPGGSMAYQANFSSSSTASMPNYGLSFNNSAFYAPNYNAYVTSPVIFMVINYTTNQVDNATLLQMSSNVGGRLYLAYYSSYISFYDLYYSGGSVTCGGTSYSTPKYITANSPTAPLSSSSGANQLIVAYIRSGTLYISLINSSTGYASPFNSNASYVAKTLNNCTQTNETPYYAVAGNLVGNMHELLIYDAALTDSQITKIISILNQKWNFY